MCAHCISTDIVDKAFSLVYNFKKKQPMTNDDVCERVHETMSYGNIVGLNNETKIEFLDYIRNVLGNTVTKQPSWYWVHAFMEREGRISNEHESPTTECFERMGFRKDVAQIIIDSYKNGTYTCDENRTRSVGLVKCILGEHLFKIWLDLFSDHDI